MVRSFVEARAARHRSAAAALGFYLAAFATLLARILKDTRGHFTYSLDDAYIHLALAQRLRHGLYGLNAGEFSSPSSSALWPWLFAPFGSSALLQYLPLCLNFVFGTIAAVLLGNLFDRYRTRLYTTAWARVIYPLLAVLLVVGTNCLGLTFTGLEQMLELLLCIGSAYLCICLAEQQPVRNWMLLCAALLPLVRYEGLLVCLAVALLLLVNNKGRQAALVVTCGLVPLALFSLALHRMGLPLLPMSVLIKGASVTATGGHAHAMVSVALQSLRLLPTQRERVPVFCLAVCATALACLFSRAPRLRSLWAVLALVGWVQCLFGPVGWLWRYEMYCIGFLLPVLLACQLGRWQDGAQVSWRGWFSAFPFLTALLLVGHAYVYSKALLLTPNASQSIRRQQGSLAVLTHTFYTGPVAVGDLGMVAFDRSPDHYVLDMTGLGSPEVFRLTANHTVPLHLPELLQAHRIGLIAVYPEPYGADLKADGTRSQSCAETTFVSGPPNPA